MAREQIKRENLLGEAVAYSRRILLALRWKGRRCELFGGYRQGCGWSLYFDESPVIQFNAKRELRRLFIDDRKLAAEDGRLVELKRNQVGGRVEHHRLALPRDEERMLLNRCLEFLRHADQALQRMEFAPLGQVPTDDAELLSDLATLVAEQANGFAIAQSAAAKA